MVLHKASSLAAVAGDNLFSARSASDTSSAVAFCPIVAKDKLPARPMDFFTNDRRDAIVLMFIVERKLHNTCENCSESESPP